MIDSYKLPEYVVFFDGVCNLCNGLVKFLIPRDKQAKLHFAPLQSEQAQQLLKENNLSTKELSTVVLYKKGIMHTKSAAGIRILAALGGFWKLMYVFLIVPSPLRDLIYNFIANNRYKWFGKSETCMFPTPEIKERFLD